MPSLSLDEFAALVRGARASEPGGSSQALVVPLSVRLLAGQVTPVLGYRRPVGPGERTAPRDDRLLPDLHFGFYDGVVVFDHVDKLVHVVELAITGGRDDPGDVYDRATGRLARRADEIQRHSKPLPSGVVEAEGPAAPPLASNITRQQHAAMVARAKEYIAAGDIFQVVLGQRFERRSEGDPVG